MTDPRIEAMYRAGVGARRPTPAQEAMMARMMRDLESVPDATINDLDAAATEIAPDPEVRPYYGRRHGVPASMDGTPAMRGAEFASPEEAAEYTISGRDPDTGARTPSQFAQDMLGAHNLAQVAGVNGPAFMPGGPPPMHIDGVINPNYLRYQEMVQGTPADEARGIAGKAPMWEAGGTRTTPEGGSVEVLVPSQANRNRMAAFETRQRRARMGKRLLREADRAGIAVDEDDVFIADADSVAEMRMRAQAAAESSLRQQRMFAGGAQNLNAGNVGQIRELLRLRDTDPETYNAMLAENMRPRNFQYRFDPRTGGVTYSEETAFPPVGRGADTQVNVQTDILNRQERQRQEEREMELRRIAVQARDYPITFADMAGHSRYDQVQAALQRAGATPEQVSLILAEVFPGQQPGPRGWGPGTWSAAPPQGPM